MQRSIMKNILTMKLFEKKRTQAELYHKKLEAFKAHYKAEFDIALDDDILYIIIRMNEMQLDFQRQIKAIPEVRFKSAWEYFLYALGSSLKFFWILVAALVLSAAIVYYADHKVNYPENTQSQIKKDKDTVSEIGVSGKATGLGKKKSRSK